MTTAPDRGVLDRARYPSDLPVEHDYGPPMHQLVISVPANIPEEVVQLMWRIGQNAVSMLHHGAAVLLFPTVRTDDQGRQIPSIGQQDILIHQPKDLELLQSLARRITEINVQIAQAMQQGPAQQLEASVQGSKAKQNAARQAVGQLDGTGGIIIPA